jgi:hypothetical protein
MPKQQASLPSSQNQEMKLAHQEQMTATQGIGANQAKHTMVQTAWVIRMNVLICSYGGTNVTCSWLLPWFQSQPSSTFKQVKFCTYIFVCTIPL